MTDLQFAAILTVLAANYCASKAADPAVIKRDGSFSWSEFAFLLAIIGNSAGIIMLVF